ncbi:MAG: hypothetical protein ACKOF9_08395 [Burkholderiales bacterium]
MSSTLTGEVAFVTLKTAKQSAEKIGELSSQVPIENTRLGIAAHYIWCEVLTQALPLVSTSPALILSPGAKFHIVSA